MECEMLTKKVRVLEGQYATLEGTSRRRQGDVEMRLAEQATRLDHYEVGTAVTLSTSQGQVTFSRPF